MLILEAVCSSVVSLSEWGGIGVAGGSRGFAFVGVHHRADGEGCVVCNADLNDVTGSVLIWSESDLLSRRVVLQACFDDVLAGLIDELPWSDDGAAERVALFRIDTDGRPVGDGAVVFDQNIESVGIIVVVTNLNTPQRRGRTRRLGTKRYRTTSEYDQQTNEEVAETNPLHNPSTQQSDKCFPPVPHTREKSPSSMLNLCMTVENSSFPVRKGVTDVEAVCSRLQVFVSLSVGERVRS